MKPNYFEAKSPTAVRVKETVVGDVTTTYVGNAAPGTADADEAWQIQKIVADSALGTTVITFPEGSSHYKFAWTDAETLVYS